VRRMQPAYQPVLAQQLCHAAGNVRFTRPKRAKLLQRTKCGRLKRCAERIRAHQQCTADTDAEPRHCDAFFWTKEAIVGAIDLGYCRPILCKQNLEGYGDARWLLDSFQAWCTREGSSPRLMSLRYRLSGTLCLRVYARMAPPTQ